MSTVTFQLTQLTEAAVTRPPGYLNRVMSMGQLSEDGKSLTLTKEAYDTLVQEYGLWDPTLKEMLANYARATAKWASSGCPVVPNNKFRANLGTCRACVDPAGNPMWDEEARGGRGKCRVCGCGQGKLWWGTQVCPWGKWDNRIVD